MTQEIAQELEQQVNGASEAGAAVDTAVEDVAEIDVDIDILEEESLDASNPLLDSLRRVLMAGIGMVALAQEEIEDFVNRLIDRGEIALDAGIHGRGRGCRIRGLGIHIVGLDQRQIGKILVVQDIIVAEPTLFLTVEQADGVIGADAVAVCHEQDDVLGTTGDRLAGELALDLRLGIGIPGAFALVDLLRLPCRCREQRCRREPEGTFHGCPPLLLLLCRDRY